MTTAYDQDKVLDTLKTTIQALEWSAGVKVFGPQSVVVSMVPPNKAIDQRRTPLCQIQPGDDTADEDEPGLRDMNITILIYAMDRRDELGEVAILGAADGKGLLQTARKVELALQKLGRGVMPIRHIKRGGGAMQLEDINLAYRDFRFITTVAVEAET